MTLPRSVKRLISERKEAVRLSRKPEYKHAKRLDDAARMALAVANTKQPEPPRLIKTKPTTPVPPSNTMRRG